MEGPTLEKKIKEYKAFLRDLQRAMGPEWFAQVGGVATIDRQLIIIDALLPSRKLNYNRTTMPTPWLTISRESLSPSVTTA